MTCPICAFPGNDAAAIRCANCGFSMRPPPPNPAPGPDLSPAPDSYPAPGPDFDDLRPPVLAAAPAAHPPVAHPPVADPVLADPVLADSAVAEPVVADPVLAEALVADQVLADPVLADSAVAEAVVADPVLAESVVTDPVVALTRVPGPPPGLHARSGPRRSRVVAPLTVLAAGLVIAGAAVAVVRMPGGVRFRPAAAEATAARVAPSGPRARPSSTAQAGPSPAGGVPGSPAGPPGAGPGVQAGAGGPGVQAGAGPGVQAAAVDAVLDASAASRAKLNAAIVHVEECTGVEQAIADLGAVGAERQAQLDGVAALDLSGLPEGEQLRALLTEALGHSLAADQGFVRWGQAVLVGGCGSGRGDYREAQRRSRLAGDAKARFLTVWNPVADRTGLRRRTSDI